MVSFPIARAIIFVDKHGTSSILRAMQEEKKAFRIAGHQPGLDGVRGLAIIGVMAVHFLHVTSTHNLLEKVVTTVASYGVLGVDLFFVLSGFLITGILIDCKGTPNYFRNFYARRTLRIFPLYFGVLALLFQVLPLFIQLDPHLEVAREKQVWLWTYTANFLISKTGTWSLGPVSHFWTLAIEEHFYIFWPLVVFLAKPRLMERICVGVIIMALALRLVLSALGESEISIGVLTPCRIDAMCAGGLMASIIRRSVHTETIFRRAAAGMMVLTGIIITLTVAGKLFPQAARYLLQVRGSFVALLFAAFTVMSLKQPWRPKLVGNFLENRFLRFLGKYSYGLYVYHGILAMYFHREMTAMITGIVGHPTLALFIKALIGSTISLGIAWVSYEVFEKKFLAMKRYFEARKPSAEA